MRIPRFWVAAEGSATGPTGRRWRQRAWGWSMSSAAEALAVAHEQLLIALEFVRSGTRLGAYYPRKPLREPILDERVIDGEQVLVVTRNRYGADILNTDRVLIADVDLDGLERGFGEFWRRLFGRGSQSADPSGEPPPVLDRVGQIAAWAATHPQFGVIVYRTASGLRVFVTGVDEPTSSAEGHQILTELGADPVYRELCRAHGTFRARLTPKPWRLPGMKAPRIGRWPLENERAERRFQRWLATYLRAAVDYAVCRRLSAYGPTPSTLEDDIIRFHDDRTRVASALPLA